MPSISNVDSPGIGMGLPDEIERHLIGSVWLELKADWGDDWEWLPELTPHSAELLVAAMGTGRLVFDYRYGPREKPQYLTLPEWSPKWPSLAGMWVRLQQQTASTAYTLWIGRVEHPQEDVHGDQTVDPDSDKQAMGLQTWVAYGARRILERHRLTRSLWRSTAGTAYTLGWLPDFNMRHGDPGMGGNRSGAPAQNTGWSQAVYVFAGTENWTAAQIIKYGLRMLMDENTNGPVWTIGGDAWFLDDYYPRINMAGISSLTQLIRRCIPLSRGIDYIVVPTTDGFKLWVYGLSGEAIDFEGHAGLQNISVVPLTISEEAHQQIAIEYSQAERCDKLRLVGDRVLSVFTLQTQLLANWTSDEEDAYKAGVTTGTPTAKEHDSFRSDERFRSVYQELAIDIGDFNYFGGHANPVFDAFGNYTKGGSTDFQRFEVGTFAKLPLETGYDYTTNPPTTRRPTNAKAEYLPLLAYVYDPRSGQWVMLNKLSAANPEYANIAIRALEHEIGVLLRSSPNHVLAKGHWSGAAASEYDPEAIGFAWDGIAITVAVETDQRPSIEIEVDPALAAGDGSVKEIVVPLVQFWWLTGSSIVGVDEAGDLLYSPTPGGSPNGIELRNDVALLYAMASGAIAQYTFERVRCTIIHRGRIEPWEDMTGAILELTGEQGEVNQLQTPVTSVMWDFRDNYTRILCGMAER